MKETAAENIVPLSIVQTEKPKRLEYPPPGTPRKDRFKIIAYTNAGGSTSWRVTGTKGDGRQLRKNYSDPRRAEAEKLKLEAEFLACPVGVQQLQPTHLTAEQVKIAEAAFAQLKDQQDLLAAVHHWKHTGRPNAAVEAPRLDKAVKEFTAWLEATPTLRQRTKGNLRQRVTLFANTTDIGNAFVNDITAEDIDGYLLKRKVSPASRDNDRRGLSRFFRWCIERPRRWITANPCREVRVEKHVDTTPPAVLTVNECKALLRAAEAHREGRLVPYMALCLFGALRPFEAARLSWEQINLKDGEIRIEAHQSKVKRARTIAISPTLAAWLKSCKGNPIAPPNFRKDFDAIKLKAGFTARKTVSEGKKAWVEDVLRHTGISHYFRDCGSYGKAAEWAGNSEAIIKKFYQGRVSSTDTVKFYALMPK